MTPICDEHSALLKSIAANLNSRDAILVYSDWLQERSNPGYFAVLHYPPWEWAIPSDPEQRRSHWGKLDYSTIYKWKLPWLEGVVSVTPNINRRTVTKVVLKAYGNRKAK